ncbi:LysR substrate-binding domain-containing protein [Bowmanella dokdonensis]|nr:LysR substrate-binding domain-containing protein [Bowmanella dokdonensis]
MRLPPLKSLQYFQVAASLLSFKQAASQLNVTQAAISQQIRLLESHLDLPLFVRLNREVRLTEQGQQLFGYVTEAFNSLEQGVASLGRDPRPDVLNITLIPSFANRWLASRLGDFHRQHPQFSVRLLPTTQRLEFEGTDLDLAIRFGQGSYADLHSIKLLDDYFYPICHPNLLKASRDLRQVPLLVDVSGDDQQALGLFMQENHLQLTDCNVALQSQDSSLIIEAALAGQGLALVRHSLVYELIQRGLLARVNDFQCASLYSYYLVAPQRYFEREKIRQFQQWLTRAMAPISEAAIHTSK